jgi:hypothetical protein
MAIIGSSSRPICTFPSTREDVQRVKDRMADLGYTKIQDRPGTQGLGFHEISGDPPSNRSIPEQPGKFWEIFGIEYKEFAKIDENSNSPNTE